MSLYSFSGLDKNRQNTTIISAAAFIISLYLTLIIVFIPSSLLRFVQNEGGSVESQPKSTLIPSFLLRFVQNEGGNVESQSKSTLIPSFLLRFVQNEGGNVESQPKSTLIPSFLLRFVQNEGDNVESQLRTDHKLKEDLLPEGSRPP